MILGDRLKSHVKGKATSPFWHTKIYSICFLTLISGKMIFFCVPSTYDIFYHSFDKVHRMYKRHQNLVLSRDMIEKGLYRLGLYYRQAHPFLSKMAFKRLICFQKNFLSYYRRPSQILKVWTVSDRTQIHLGCKSIHSWENGLGLWLYFLSVLHVAQLNGNRQSFHPRNPKAPVVVIFVLLRIKFRWKGYKIFLSEDYEETDQSETSIMKLANAKNKIIADKKRRNFEDF